MSCDKVVWRRAAKACLYSAFSFFFPTPTQVAAYAMSLQVWGLGVSTLTLAQGLGVWGFRA